MGVLARADENQLVALTEHIELPSCDVLRGPDQGLVMVRGATRNAICNRSIDLTQYAVGIV
jgi:alpha-D-ribose 1-methylphosphonate 5-triphosphate synthase subunit PhnG